MSTMKKLFEDVVWEDIANVPLSLIEASDPAWNSRIPENYTDSDIDPLAESMKLSRAKPTLLARHQKDGRFEVVDGNRRRLAAIKAGFEHVNITVATLTDVEAAQLSLGYNLGIKSLSEYEEVRSIHGLHERGLNSTQINAVRALAGGKEVDKALISKMLKLWEKLDTAIREGDFRKGHPLAKWRFLHDTILKADDQIAAWKAVCAPASEGNGAGAGEGEEGEGNGKEKTKTAPSKKQLKVDLECLKEWQRAALDKGDEETAETLANGILWLKYALGERKSLPVKRPAYAGKDGEGEE